MAGIYKLWQDFPVMTGSFTLVIAVRGSRFWAGLTSWGDTVGMLGHDKLCLIIRRRSRAPRRPSEPHARPQGERRASFLKF